ncbi:hypothetical protein [Streptomyces sp. NPDC053542]|uniref:hypothetical protein n=1 Tax=Streptomyces sp. NPDC053542 TaxID=3365710 RepID=UPI0037D455DC
MITQAAELAWPKGLNRHQPAAATDLQPWIASLEADDVGLTMLLCVLLRWTDDIETAALAPSLFSRAWATGTRHLQYAGVDLLAGIHTTVDVATESQVIELLNGVHTDDIWVSTPLVETLHRYGQLTSPSVVEDITKEITLLLAHPEQPEAPARARGIVNSQFEEVISAPFIEAIDALEPVSRRALLTLAVQEGDATLFTDVVLKELVHAKDPSALPAMQYWAPPTWTMGPSGKMPSAAICSASKAAPPTCRPHPHYWKVIRALTPTHGAATGRSCSGFTALASAQVSSTHAAYRCGRSSPLRSWTQLWIRSISSSTPPCSRGTSGRVRSAGSSTPSPRRPAPFCITASAPQPASPHSSRTPSLTAAPPPQCGCSPL